MDNITTSITELQQKLELLQQIKKETEENCRKNDCESNLQIIKEAYESRMQKVKEKHYSKSCIVAKFVDNGMIGPLEAIYNVLTNMNNRLIKLEQCK